MCRMVEVRGVSHPPESKPSHTRVCFACRASAGLIAWLSQVFSGFLQLKAPMWGFQWSLILLPVPCVWRGAGAAGVRQQFLAGCTADWSTHRGFGTFRVLCSVRPSPMAKPLCCSTTLYRACGLKIRMLGPSQIMAILAHMCASFQFDSSTTWEVASACKQLWCTCVGNS